MSKIRVKDLEVANVSSIVATDASGIPFYAGATPSVDGLWTSMSNVISFKSFSDIVKNGVSYDTVNHWIKLGGSLNETTTISGLSTYGLNLNALTSFNVAATSINLNGTLTLGALVGSTTRDLVISDLGVVSTLPVLSLTNTGTSGAATYNPTTRVLNIPIYSGGGGGISGLTNNYITKATSPTTIGDSSIFDNGTTVMIGTAIAGPTFKLFVESSGTNTAIAGSAQNGFAGYFESANTSSLATLYVVRSNTSAPVAEFHSALNSVIINGNGSIFAGAYAGSNDRMLVVDSTGLMATKSLYAYDVTSASTFNPSINQPAVFNGSTPATWTLPVPSISNDGRQIVCENIGTDTVTIDSASGSQIWGAGSSMASTTMGLGGSITFVCRNNGGTYYWFMK